VFSGAGPPVGLAAQASPPSNTSAPAVIHAACAVVTNGEARGLLLRLLLLAEDVPCGFLALHDQADGLQRLLD